MPGREETYAEPKPRYWATIGLLVVNAIVFVVQQYAARFHPAFPVDNYFTLSLEGLHKGYVWQLLTFQFMHGGIWHILFNSWAIFIFGRLVEISIGWRRMLQVYFISGVAGGLAQMLGAWLLPVLFPVDGVLGASAGALGLVAAFSVLYPRQNLWILLVVVPLKLQARTLLWVLTVMSIGGIFYPFWGKHLPPYLGIIQDFFANVAHAAHLGGIAAGWLLTRRLLKRYERARPLPPIIKPPEVEYSRDAGLT